MTQNLKYASPRGTQTARRIKRRAAYSGYSVKYSKSRFEIKAEMLEDACLNAIADERSDGPFVKVSLDDL